MVLSNVVFNYILIFGKFGFPQLGIAGAAIGSSLAEMVSVIFFIIYTWKRIDCKKYALNILPKFHGKTLKRILNVSVWTMIQNFVSLSTWFMFFLFVEHLGERSLAIANIIRNVSGIPFMIAMAFASTCGSLVSNLMGSGDSGRVMDTFKKVSRLCYVFILPLIFVMALFPNSVMRIYTDNSALIQSAVPAYYVMIFVYLVSVPANILFNTVSGTGNTRSALFIELIALVAYVLSVIYLVIYLKADVAICWTTEYIYLVCMFSLTYWYMKKGNWKNKKI